MTADDEHADLVSAWDAVHLILDRMPTLLQWHGAEYMEVRDMGDRVRGVRSHLAGAVRLIDEFRYEPALALIRTSLEHVLVDWLVFRGSTFVRRYREVEDETWAQWQADRAAGAEWTRTIKNWTRYRKGDVRIVFEGLSPSRTSKASSSRSAFTTSCRGQYQPAMGPPSQQAEDGPIGRDELRQFAGENQALWEVYLTWGSLPTNLQENAVVDADDAGRLSAYYRFLSGYTHPVADHRRATYGPQVHFGWPRYDHYSSELVLLYAIALGILEARNFLTSVAGRRGLSIANVEQVISTLDNAEATIAHFWFLGSTPHTYDIWKARNELIFRRLRPGQQSEPPPESESTDVPYPRDPLQRLVAIHSSAYELMSGLAYTSPWPRADARSR